MRDEPARRRSTSSARCVVPMPRFVSSFWPSGVHGEHACCTLDSSSRRMSLRVVPPVALLELEQGRAARAASASRTVRTAMLEATSPAAWPPMPSATMKRLSFLSTRNASSLWSRTRPTSEAGQKRMAFGSGTVGTVRGSVLVATVAPERTVESRCWMRRTTRPFAPSTASHGAGDRASGRRARPPLATPLIRCRFRHLFGKVRARWRFLASGGSAGRAPSS